MEMFALEHVCDVADGLVRLARMRHLAASDLGACAREASHGHRPATKGTKAIEHNANPNVMIDCWELRIVPCERRSCSAPHRANVEEAPLPAP